MGHGVCISQCNVVVRKQAQIVHKSVGTARWAHRSQPAFLCSLPHRRQSPVTSEQVCLYEILTVQISGMVTSPDWTLTDTPHWNFRQGLGLWLGPAESLCSGSSYFAQCLRLNERSDSVAVLNVKDNKRVDILRRAFLPEYGQDLGKSRSIFSCPSSTSGS